MQPKLMHLIENGGMGFGGFIPMEEEAMLQDMDVSMMQTGVVQQEGIAPVGSHPIVFL